MWRRAPPLRLERVLLVYDKLGVRILRRAWINSDHLWAASFIAAGAITLIT